MSDIGTPWISTLTCSACGAQNSSDLTTCTDCGTALPGPDGDRQREVLEVEEAWRGAAASGYDVDAAVADGSATCPSCGTALAVDDLPLDRAWQARDTEGPEELIVVAYDCPGCRAPLRAVVPASEREAEPIDPNSSQDQSTGGPKREEMRDTHRSGAAPQDPVEAHPDRFEAGAPGNLADLGPLQDAEGEDIRHYTGEPVETDEGWVIPQQQNFAGKDNIAGGGEWPDPNTPSTQVPSDDAGGVNTARHEVDPADQQAGPGDQEVGPAAQQVDSVAREAETPGRD